MIFSVSVEKNPLVDIGGRDELRGVLHRPQTDGLAPAGHHQGLAVASGAGGLHHDSLSGADFG